MPNKIAISGIALLVVLVPGSVVIFGSDSPRSRVATACHTDSDAAPTSSPGGTLEQQQITNAQAIARAAKEAGVGGRGTLVGLTVAVGESDLIALNYGDAAGPDSRGVFQQRTSWGTEAQRMDPYQAAKTFFAHLIQVPGWDKMTVTDAGHAVQRNANPAHYAPFQARAEAIAKKAGIDLTSPITAHPIKGDGPADTRQQLTAGQADCRTFGSSFDPSGKDDYPYKNSAHCLINPGGGYNIASCPIGTPLGAWPRECVDFDSWRINQALGSTTPPYKFTMSGNATTWLAQWQAKGWPTGHEPKPGAVSYYPAFTGGSGETGHVGIVLKVNPNGQDFVEEGYNGKAPPEDHTYYTRTVKNFAPAAYLYLPPQQ